MVIMNASSHGNRSPLISCGYFPVVNFYSTRSTDCLVLSDNVISHYMAPTCPAVISHCNAFQAILLVDGCPVVFL